MGRFQPDEWKKKSDAFAAEQEKQKKLEAATVAFAQPGQMQSERDFNQQGEDTTPVQPTPGQVHYGRRGTKWFSFDLPVDPSHPMSVIVTYNNDERARGTFDILVDGQKVGEHTTDRHQSGSGVAFLRRPYAIPPATGTGKAESHGAFSSGRRKCDLGSIRNSDGACGLGAIISAPI